MFNPELFKRYHDLIHKIDLFCEERLKKFAGHIHCRAGCAGCCKHDILILPVEFYCLRSTTLAARSACVPQGRDACVFLYKDRCRIYPVRPVICRTHGLPLLLKTAGGEQRDCCPLNFQDRSLESLQRCDLLDLEALNTLLSAVNLLFCRQAGLDPEQRINLSRLLDEPDARRSTGP